MEEKKGGEYGRYTDVCKRYGIGRSTALELVKKTGAGVKYGKAVIVDLSIIDAYFENLRKQQQKAQ